MQLTWRKVKFFTHKFSPDIYRLNSSHMKRQSKRTALNTVNPISFPFNMPTPQVTFPFGQPSIHFWHWKHSPCTILVFASLNSIFAGQLLVHLLHPFIQLSLFLSREKNGKIGSKEKLLPSDKRIYRRSVL